MVSQLCPTTWQILQLQQRHSPPGQGLFCAGPGAACSTSRALFNPYSGPGSWPLRNGGLGSSIYWPKSPNQWMSQDSRPCGTPDPCSQPSCCVTYGKEHQQVQGSAHPGASRPCARKAAWAGACQLHVSTRNSTICSLYVHFPTES